MKPAQDGASYIVGQTQHQLGQSDFRGKGSPNILHLDCRVSIAATACRKALAWSFLFCFVIMTIWAMLMVEVVCLG